MPLKRTSPNLPPALTQSDSDLPGLSKSSATEFSAKIPSRNKRLRPESDSSPPQDYHVLMDKQMSILNKLAADVSEIKIQNSNIQKTNDDIQKKLEISMNNQEEMKIRIEKLEKEKKDRENYILTLESRIESLEYGSRSACVELRNIPSIEKETPMDLATHVINVGRALDINIPPAELRDVYRLPGKNRKNRPIVAELKTVMLKSQLLTAASKKNKALDHTQKLNTRMIGLEDSSPIYMSEYLAGSSRKLFYLSKEFAKNNDFKFCWAVNGKIYIRKDESSKQIRISSETTLNGLHSDA